jgi:hypothetical protein
MFFDSIVSFPVSAYPPIAVGFFGLATGYLIYGPQELFKFPPRNRRVDVSTGIWGIWMPGFMQFLTGVYLFAGLAWFHSFSAPALYMAALAFTAYGVHWWAIGMNRLFQADPRPNAFMAIAFTLISILGIIVFFTDKDSPVGGLFIGLTCIYVSDFFASLNLGRPTGGEGGPEAVPAGVTPPRSLATLGERAEQALGFFHLGTGLWLIYLTFATALNFAAGYNLPL